MLALMGHFLCAPDAKKLFDMSTAHQHLMHLIGESFNLGLIVRETAFRNYSFRISPRCKKNNKKCEKRPVAKVYRTLGRGRKRRRFSNYFDQLLYILKLCLRLSIAIRISFLRLGLPRNMSRAPIKSYPYAPQHYEESELSESEQSDSIQQQEAINNQMIRPVGRPASASVNQQLRSTPRPVSRQRNRPASHIGFSPVHARQQIPSDVHEIFRRRSNVTGEFIQDDYSHIDQFFFKPSPTYPLQQKKSIHAASAPPLPYQFQTPPDGHHFEQQSFDNEQYQDVPCRNIPRVSSNKGSTTKVSSGTGLTAVKANPKRHPVTAKTPRYFKKTSSATACKQPTALCLPLAAQPDPYSRKGCEKEIVGDQIIGTNNQKNTLERHHSFPVNKGEKIVRPLTAPNENTSTKTNAIENVLKRYEEMVNGLGNCNIMNVKENVIKDTSTKGVLASCGNKVQIKHVDIEQNSPNENDLKIINEVKNSRKQSPRSPRSPPQKDEQASTVLQTMLQELMDKGCINKIPENMMAKATENKNNRIEESNEKNATKTGTNANEIAVNKAELSEVPKSINYQEMQESIHKVPPALQETVAGASNSKEIQFPSVLQLKDKASIMANSHSKSVCHNCKLNPEDNNYSMELHRSKSYIVNLIDRALSKELGTTPDDRNYYCNALLKEQSHIEPKSVLEMVGRNIKKGEVNDLSLDLSNVFSDSRTSNEIAHNLEIKDGCTCPCSASHGDEPLYIKQLKQLRWGHLKHIQREVRRLADLERFLDSCSANYD